MGCSVIQINNLTETAVFFKFTPGERMIEASKGLLTGNYALFIWGFEYDACFLARKSRGHFLTDKAFADGRMTENAISFLKAIQAQLAQAVKMLLEDGHEQGQFLILSKDKYEKMVPILAQDKDVPF